jgi:hypothetical protein
VNVLEARARLAESAMHTAILRLQNAVMSQEIRPAFRAYVVNIQSADTRLTLSIVDWLATGKPLLSLGKPDVQLDRNHRPTG